MERSSHVPAEAAEALDGMARYARYLLWAGEQRCPRRSTIPTLPKRGMVVTDETGRKHFAPVVRFRMNPPRPLYSEPLLGEHTEEMLKR